MNIKFNIKIEKQHFYFLIVLIAVLFAVGVSASLNPGKTVGHDASEVVAGTFGFGEFIFPNNVTAGNITIMNNAKIEGELYAVNVSAANITTGNLSVKHNIAAGNLTISSSVNSLNGITLGGVRKTRWPILDYCYYNCWTSYYYYCGGTSRGASDYICCQKIRLSDNNVIATNINIGWSHAVTVTILQGAIVKC